MVCRTLEIGLGKTLNEKRETKDVLTNRNEQIEGKNKMRDQFGAVAFNIRTALRRVEDLRQEVEREVNKNVKENIYEVKSSVNNLMGIMKLANENLNEIEALLKKPNVKADGTLKNGT